MSESHWRDRAAPIIARVIAANAGKDESAIRFALRDAYPFGAYKYQQYRVWQEEITRQLGAAPQPEAARQDGLFD
jgi:hypothetical protein